MSFEVLHEKKPSCSTPATVLVVVLAVLGVAVAAGFAYLLISGRGNDYQLGTLLAFEFLIAGVLLIAYAKGFASFREIAEEREETVLW